MQHPTQSPIDPDDLPPGPAGEVPPVAVRVPTHARTVLRDAGLDLGVLDDALVRASLEETVAALGRLVTELQRITASANLALLDARDTLADRGRP